MSIVKRAAFGALGTAAVLGYWSLRGGSSSSKATEGIPPQVWGGGAATLSVDVDGSSPGRFSITFDERDKSEPRSLETWTKVEPGPHHWTVDVPARVGGYIDFGADNPKVGDHLYFKIMVNNQIVDEQSDTLKEPLQSGYAFGIQAHFEDYSKGNAPGEE
jgi:hypothetical protein